MKCIASKKALWLALAIVPAICGCGSSSNEPQTRVRVINAALGTNAGIPTDVSANGQRIFTNVGFGASSARLQVASGSTVPVLAESAGTGVTLMSGTLNLTPSVDQSILVTGIQGASGAQGLQVVSLSPEDLSSTPTNGQFRVYFINAAPDSASASFSYTVNGGSVQTNGDLTNVSYLQMTPAQIPQSGSVVFTATVGAQSVSSSAVTIQGGKTYTVVLTGRTAGSGAVPGLTLQVLQDN